MCPVCLASIGMMIAATTSTAALTTVFIRIVRPKNPDAREKLHDKYESGTP